MDWKDIAAQWKVFRAPIREQWSKIADEQLDVVDGSRERLIGAIRKAYAISQEQAEKQVAAWAKRVDLAGLQAGANSRR